MISSNRNLRLILLSVIAIILLAVSFIWLSASKDDTQISKAYNIRQYSDQEALKASISDSPNTLKHIIKEDCAIIRFNLGSDTKSISFLAGPEPDHPGFIAAAQGQAGTVIYDMNGSEVWRNESHSNVVSSFGEKLLVYREFEGRNELEEFSIEAEGQIISVDIQSPSAIAPTTLQRNAYASLGPARVNKKTVIFETSSIQFNSKVTALAATSSSINPSPTHGAVAFILDKQTLEIWNIDSVRQGCSEASSNN